VQDQTSAPEDLRVGDTVRLKDASQVGEILEIKGAFAVILSGNARLRAKLQNLAKVSSRGPRALEQPQVMYTPEGKTEIDLRGMLGEEAVAQVEGFLDDALIAGLHRVDIIHGKGTGALRKRVAEFLRIYPHVKSFRLGEWNEGGTGVTVVELE